MLCEFMLGYVGQVRPGYIRLGQFKPGCVSLYQVCQKILGYYFLYQVRSS
jgi:hypothetical protein